MWERRARVGRRPGGRIEPIPSGRPDNPLEARIFDLFDKIGRDCFLLGLVSSHAGNLSVRTGDRILISRRGAMLGALTPRDLVTTGILEDDENTQIASCELPTHRAVYRHTGAGALLHTHPPHGIVLSLGRDRIRPVDAEGLHQFGSIPVVTAHRPVGSTEMAEVIADALSKDRLCMLRGHGLFAHGETLEEAFMLTTAFEASARVGWLSEVGAYLSAGKDER